MITDVECNTVYFSEKLKSHFPEDFSNISQALMPFDHIRLALLKGTKDEWARDYMPIQTAEKRLVKFRYQPSFETRSNWTEPTKVIKLNQLKSHFSKHHINLAGGNVVKAKHKVIVSDRIISENYTYHRNPSLLISRLEEDLQTEVIILKSHPAKWDMTGHASGMLRFVNDTTLIGNPIDEQPKEIRCSLEKFLAQHQLDYIDLPHFRDTNENHYSAIGAYINFLEIADVILFPVFNHTAEKNDEAMSIMKNTFKNRTIIPLNIDAVGKHGGLLNCISWCLKK